MIPLQELYEAGFEDLRQDSKEPSTDEILEWAEQWAYQLQLWGNTDTESIVETTLDHSTSNEIPSLTDFYQQEQNIAELHNYNFRSVQNHPHKRREANQLIDNLLRDAGVPDNDIARYGQVLPLKIAGLHQIKCPQLVRCQIPVWLYKRNINADRLKSANRDLCFFLIEVRTSLEELQRRLHQAASSSLPEHTDWEYSLLEGPNTKRSPTNSGILRRSSDWRNVSRQILSSKNSYHAMIVFQRLDMHKPYKPRPTLDESQEIGMSKINQLIKNAQTHQFDTQVPSSIHVLHQDEALYSSHDSNLRPEPRKTNLPSSKQVKQPGRVAPVSKVKRVPAMQPISRTQLHQNLPPVSQSAEPRRRTNSHTLRDMIRSKNDLQNEQDSLLLSGNDFPSLPMEEIALSKYLTVWLEHGETVDPQVSYPHYNAS